VRKAKNRYKDSLRVPEERQKRIEAPEAATDLSAEHRAAFAAEKPLESQADARGDFNRAAGSGGDGDGGGDDTGGIRPVARASRPQGRGTGRGRGRRDDFERER
ncbi:MAG: relaxase, partial [Rhizobiaceae bacterium]